MIYWDNGQLSQKGEFREGEKVGLWEGYWENGQLNYRGEIKDGLRNGPWISFWEDGAVDSLNTGTWKNGRMVSD